MTYTPPTPVASGSTFAQFQLEGLSGHLEKLLAAQVATAKPTVAHTWTATGGGASGGALAAGTYYSVVTESNGFGETLVGPESSQITVSATNIPRITFQTLKSGNISRNVYIGAPGGVSGGPYTLYVRGITASTYDLSTAAPIAELAPAPPTVNSTVPNGKIVEFVRSAEAGRLMQPYRQAREVISSFNRGGGADFAEVEQKLREVHATFILIKTCLDEIMVLIDANPGHLTNVATGIQGIGRKRVWP